MLLVLGEGLAHGSSQTEHDAWARAVMDGDLTQAEACWMMQGQDASATPLEALEQVESADALSQDLICEGPPPPVFADYSHYKGTPRGSRKEKQRGRRAPVW